MRTRLTSYLVLPTLITPFERAYLLRVNRIALAFFTAHIPLFALIALVNGRSVGLAVGLTTLMVAGPWLGMRVFRNPRHVSVSFAFAAMCLGGVLVHIGQGPMQIEMHFYFFVLIALLAVFANPVVILVAAATVTVHHLLLWILIPSSVFNYDASFWTVGVHALFVVIESVAACFVARSFFDDVIGLERIVQSRTAEVEASNRAIRLILDTVGQGFVTIDLEGTPSVERSAAVDRWFGPPIPGEKLWDWLGRSDPSVGPSLHLGWEGVLEDILPIELSLTQLPSGMRLGETHLRIAYTPVLEDGRLSRALVVLTDITAEVARARIEGERRDLMAIFDRALSDRSGLIAFVSETTSLLDQMSSCHDDLPAMRRHLHTLKGNAGLFGVSRLAAAAHTFEDRVGDLPAAEYVDALRSIWADVHASLASLLGDDLCRGVDLTEAEHIAILKAIVEGAPHATLEEMVRGWGLEPTRCRLDRLGQHAQAVARRLGKPVPRIVIEGNGERLDPAVWGNFWSAAVHLVHNAVDHGLEDAEERRAAGKPEAGVVTLVTRRDHDAMVLEVSDDGRGVCWDEVARRARPMGLPTATASQLAAALFHQGLSTQEAVSEVSGRGVGMGTVLAACEALGGQMTIQSRPAEGTTVRCVFPGVHSGTLAA